MIEQDFETIAITDDETAIRSNYALQFDAKSDANKRLRAGIRGALAQLRPPAPGELLHGIYLTSRRDPYDAENLVFYNVGSAAFRHLSVQGIRFETERISDDSPPPRHSWSYRLVRPETPFARWKLQNPPIAEWRDVPLRVSSRLTPGPFWLAMREAEVNWDREIQLSGIFGLRLCLSIPTHDNLNLYDAIKPVFDGVIAGLHSFPGDVSDILLERLATQVSPGVRNTIEIRKRATAPGALGPCRDLFRLKGSAFWHPRDHDCVAGELAVTNARTADWRLSGQLYALESLQRGWFHS